LDLVTVILIFAGKSRRFWPLCEKSFFPVSGTSLIEEQVRRLEAAGVRDILLVAGEHNLKLAKKVFPKKKILVQEDLTLGMRGALLSALPACGRKPVLIVSANDIIEPQAYRDLLSRSKKITRGGLILARKVRHYFPGGYLSLKGKRITGIVEKPKPGSEPSDMINIVAHFHASAEVLLAALKKIKPTKKDDGYEQALDLLFRQNPYETVICRGSWQAIKYPWHLLDLLPQILPSGGRPVIAKSVKIHPTAVIEGPVVIAENAKIYAHATVRGPCYIGHGSVVANNALVRDSSIGDNCVVGYNTEIVRSILASDIWTHSSYVGDSIIDKNTSFGGGTITGNLRLDEEMVSSVIEGKKTPTGRVKLGAIIGAHCRTGVHTCFVPGVRIGAGSFISSSTLVTEDIPDNSFVKEERVKLVIRSNRETPKKSGDRDSFRQKL
jgi:bifunctional UDP-N-acetylglucosamine pyrophosphorylase/glucosamine-1-phosphate N-acetyltransferase